MAKPLLAHPGLLLSLLCRSGVSNAALPGSFPRRPVWPLDGQQLWGGSQDQVAQVATRPVAPSMRLAFTPYLFQRQLLLVVPSGLGAGRDLWWMLPDGARSLEFTLYCDLEITFF